MPWYSVASSITSSVVSLARLGQRTQADELRSAWASVRRFFNSLDSLPDVTALDRELPDVKAKFDRISALLKEERGTHGNALRAEVFEIDSSEASGYFVHACTLSKTAPWPALRAVTLRFLVDAIQAADGYQGELLVSETVNSAFVDALGSARREEKHPALQLSIARMLALLCKTGAKQPAVLEMIRPARAGASTSSFIIDTTVDLIATPASPEVLDSALETFGFLVIGTGFVSDESLDHVVKSVFLRAAQEVATVCTVPDHERKRYVRQVLHAVRFYNWLCLAAPKALPLLVEPLRSLCEGLQSMLCSANDRTFAASASLTMACIRASSQTLPRQVFVNVLLQADVVRSLQGRCFDPNPAVTPSALAAFAIAFEAAPADACRVLIPATEQAHEVAATERIDLDGAFGDLMRRSRTSQRKQWRPAPNLPPMKASDVRASPLVKMLCGRFATAYEQPDDITTSCVLLALSILSVPSEALWRGLLGAEGPLRNVLGTLTSYSSDQTQNRRKDAVDREGMVKGLLSQLCGEVQGLAAAGADEIGIDSNAAAAAARDAS